MHRIGIAPTDEAINLCNGPREDGPSLEAMDGGNRKKMATIKARRIATIIFTILGHNSMWENLVKIHTKFFHFPLINIFTFSFINYLFFSIH